MVGRTLGPYEILEKIGEGGMGVVYKGRDTHLGRLVAIKVLPADKVSNPDRKQRFVQEARAASALNHPNIVTVHQIGVDAGVDYVVMEYIAGRTLDQLIPEGGMKLGELLRIAIAILEGLSRAHAAGILHRDLKPGNIMVGEDGQVKLLDFGLAKLSELHDASDADLTRPLPQTEEGSIVGTISYMSPEQAEARKVDARSDVFSFGAVLYEMATGQRAFSGRSKISTLASILRAEPRPLHELRQGLPRELEKAVARCLRKDPAWRYQSAADLRVSLGEIERELVSGEHTVSPPAKSETRRRSIAIWVPLAIAATALLTWFLSKATDRPQPEATPVRFSFTPEHLARGSVSQIDTEISVSPDGKHISYVEANGGQLWLRDIDQEVARSVAGATGVYQVFWSPDSRFIGYAHGADLVRIPAEGGAPTVICKMNGQFKRASWSSDGKTILFGDETGLYTVPAQGGTPTRLLAHPHVEHPSFLDLPNGKQAYLIQVHEAQPGHDIQVLTSDGERRTVFHTMSTNPYPVYSRTGHIVYGDGMDEATAVWALPFSLETLSATGKPYPVARPGASPSLSRTGTLIYGDPPPDQARLVWCDRQGKPLSTFGAPKQYQRPALSPDGRRLAVLLRNNGSDVWLVDLDRELFSQFSFTKGMAGDPVWSPDGKQLAYSVFRNGSFDILLAAADGGSEPVPLIATPGREMASDWSRDGRFLLFTSSAAGTKPELFYVERASDGSWSKPVPFVPAPVKEYSARLSPDGRFVCYASDQSGSSEIYVRSFPSGAGKVRVSPNGGREGRWNSNGKELFYIADNRLMSVPVSLTPELKLGAPVVLFEYKGLDDIEEFYEVAADGERFLLREPLRTDRPLAVHVIQNWLAILKPLPAAR